MLSRRNFLRSGTLTALSITLAMKAGRTTFGQSSTQNSALDFPISDTARQQPLFNYTRAAFENAIGSTFTSPDARGRSVNLTLVSVKGFESKTDTKIMTTKARSTDAFALSFNASRLIPAFTTIYALNHPVLGKFDLFMTLRKCDDGALFYDAVVNHAL
jgi:hypothetical protein